MAEAPPPSRPKLFQPGLRIGMHVQVERVVRESPTRQLYLANNDRRRWYAVKCWECGNKHSPPSAQACTYCSAPLGFRRLLMSTRWDPKSAKAFGLYAQRRIKAPTLAQPVAIYKFREQLLSLYRWSGENLLVNEPAPLTGRRVMVMAFQLADALQRLHDHGVALGSLEPEHVLLGKDGSAKLFDLEVDHLERRPITWNEDPTRPPMRDIRALAAMVDDWIPVEAQGLRELFTGFRRGQVRTADDMAAAIASWARRNGTPSVRSRAACLSDTGLVQHENEDAWGWQPLGGDAAVYAVADGLSGPEASRLAVRTVLRMARRRSADHPIDAKSAQGLLLEAFGSANQAVRKSWANQGIPQGSTGADTTMTIALVTGTQVVIAGIGDCYPFVLRGGTLQGIGSREKHVGLVGGKVTIAARIETFAGKKGDRLLLASRGLWTEVPEDRIGQILAQEADPRAAVRRLVRAANDAGGRENITALIVDLG